MFINPVLLTIYTIYRFDVAIMHKRKKRILMSEYKCPSPHTHTAVWKK